MRLHNNNTNNFYVKRYYHSYGFMIECYVLHTQYTSYTSVRRKTCFKIFKNFIFYIYFQTQQYCIIAYQIIFQDNILIYTSHTCTIL